MVSIEFCECLEKGYLIENTQQEHWVWSQIANDFNNSGVPTKKGSELYNEYKKKFMFRNGFSTFNSALKMAKKRTEFLKKVELDLNLPIHNWFQIGTDNFTKENMKKEGRCQDKGCKEFSYKQLWAVHLAYEKWPDIVTIKDDGTPVYTSGW